MDISAKSDRCPWVILSVIVVVGILLRLPLLSAGIGQDDAVTVYAASAGDLSELLNRISLYEYNPPLYHLLVQQWIRLFGSAPNVVPGVSTIFGILLIPLAFAFSRMILHDTRRALLVAFFASVSPLAVFYSHEVRGYSLFACLTACLWMAFFACLRKFSLPRLALLFLAGSVSLYTHYSSIMIMGLIVIFCVVQWTVREEDDGRRILGILGALACSGLTFLFWLPHFKRHTSFGTFWADPTPLTNFAFVVANNLAATLPLPWLLGLFGVAVVVPLYLVLTLRRARMAERIDFQLLKKRLRSDRELIFVLLNMLVAVCALGYITPFIPGYTRYIVPFSVVAFTVWCIVAAAGWARISSRMPLKARWALIAFASVGLVYVNWMEIQHLGQGGRSGLQQFAADLAAGKFGPCAVLVAPDYDSYTLLYYLDSEHKQKTPARYYTFARQGTVAPNVPDGYAETWRDSSIIDQCMSWVNSLDPRECPVLVVVHDLAVLDSAQMPAKTRIAQLLATIKGAYSLQSSHEYKSSGRSFEVSTFKLAR